MRRILSCILLPVYLSSCTSWQVQPVSPEQVVTEDQPSKIRVTLTDSSELEMEQPRIVGDTLRGLVKGKPSSDVVKDGRIPLLERDVLLDAGCSQCLPEGRPGHFDLLQVHCCSISKSREARSTLGKSLRRVIKIFEENQAPSGPVTSRRR